MTTFAPAVLSDEELVSKPMPQRPLRNMGWDASLLTLGFSCFFLDYDLDGWPDIFVANGHIEDDIEKIQQRIKYRQPPHLFHNLG